MVVVVVTSSSSSSSSSIGEAVAVKVVRGTWFRQVRKLQNWVSVGIG